MCSIKHKDAYEYYESCIIFLFEFKTVTYLHIIRIYTPIRTADCAYYASAHIPHMRKVCVTSTFIAVEGADEILSEDLSLLTRPQTKVNYFSRHFRKREVCRRGERKKERKIYKFTYISYLEIISKTTATKKIHLPFRMPTFFKV